MPAFGSADPTYSVAYLIGRAKNLMLGTTREAVNRLTNGIGTTDTALTVDFSTTGSGPSLISPGSVLAIDDELIYVWSTATTGQQITVQRGWQATVPATHSAGAIIYINPIFSQYEIRQTLKDEIRSWGPQVYAIKSVDLSSSDFVNGYDMGAISPFYDVLDVSIEPDTLVGSPDDKSWPHLDFQVRQTANTTDFPSGNALIVTSPGAIYDSPRTIHVVYSAPFNVDTNFADTADLEADVGLDASDLDIPVYGVAWRLLSGQEVRRELTNPMGSSGDLKDHPATAAIQAALQFKKLRDDRLNDAVQRLRASYPIRRAA